jgi:hypothetical protein
MFCVAVHLAAAVPRDGLCDICAAVVASPQRGVSSESRAGCVTGETPSLTTDEIWHFATPGVGALP